MLSVVSIFITVSGIVAALAAHATLDHDAQLVGGTDPQADRLNQALLVITLMLVALAAVNAIFVTWATALDAKHSSALARALGATPQQVSTGLSAAQVLPALAGAVLGIPGGLALFAALSGDETANPPLWQLLAVVPVTVARGGRAHHHPRPPRRPPPHRPDPPSRTCLMPATGTARTVDRTQASPASLTIRARWVPLGAWSLARMPETCVLTIAVR